MRILNAPLLLMLFLFLIVIATFKPQGFGLVDGHENPKNPEKEVFIELSIMESLKSLISGLAGMLGFSTSSAVSIRAGDGAGEPTECFYPNKPPDETWGDILIDNGGCVKVGKEGEYNYIAFYHSVTGVEMVYEFMDDDGNGLPGQVIASCETTSKKEDWSSCTTNKVRTDASHVIFACFRIKPGTGTGEDPKIFLGDNPVEYYTRDEGGDFRTANPGFYPVLKVCLDPSATGQTQPPATPSPPQTPQDTEVTFYPSCWDGTSYNEEQGERSRAVGTSLSSLIPINMITECEPDFPLPGFGKDDDTTGKKLIGLEYSRYNMIYYPQGQKAFADLIVDALSDRNLIRVEMICGEGVPPSAMEAQNFLCNNYGQRAYLQLSFNPQNPDPLAGKLARALEGELKNPVASFKFSPSAPVAGQNIRFDASDSYDPDGSIEEYGWDFGDGSTASEKAPIKDYTYTKPGKYSVVLTVTDDEGLKGSTTEQVEVLSPSGNRPPHASFNYNPKDPIVNQEVTFDASGSTDPDGTIVNYAWDFGDQTTGTGKKSSHTFTTAGDYVVSLTVTDNEGAFSTATKTVSVSRGPSPIEPVSEECYVPNHVAINFIAGPATERGGCVLLDRRGASERQTYNYIAWYHSKPNIDLVYDFRSVTPEEKPGEVLQSCETKSKENDWSSCVTPTVETTESIFVCFTPKGDDPWLWTDTRYLRYYFLSDDGEYYYSRQAPLVKVCKPYRSH